MSKIVRLEAENIKRLKAVSISPAGNVVEITGKNGQGKTSVLDAIWWALGGTRNVQAQPVRNGADKGFVTLDIGDYLIKRTFRRKGDVDVTTTLTVETPDGAPVKSPQEILTGLVGKLTFDPLAFVRMDAAEQVQTLRGLVSGVDFDALEEENRKDYERRQVINRQAKEKRAAASAISVPPGTPTRKVDDEEILHQIGQANSHNDKRTDHMAQRANLEARAKRLWGEADRLAEEAARLLDRSRDARAEADDAQSEADDMGDPPEKIDTEELMAQLRSARETNAAVDKHRQREAHNAEAARLEQESADLTKAMEERERQKAAAIAAAKLPVEGLSFGAGGVTLNGVPFVQASDAEQLRTSIALAMAMNPSLRVIRVRDGSLLDAGSMKLLEQMAEAADFQIWVETVSSGRKSAVVIEDGMVKG